MIDFKALYADLKALYAKHFKPAPEPKSFGNIIDGLLEAIETVEKSQVAINSGRASLMELAENVNSGPIMAKIREYANPVEEHKPGFDKHDFDGFDDDMMFI